MSGSRSRGRARVASAALAAMLVALAGAGCGDGERRQREAQEALKQRLQGAPPEGLGPRADTLWKSARRFYEEKGHAYVWVDEDGATDRGQALQKAVAEVAADGLNPASYDLKPAEPLQAAKEGSWLRRKRVAPAQLAEAEVRHTAAYLKLASELLVGRVEPSKVDPHWFGQYRLNAPERLLARAVEQGKVRETLDTLVPHHPQYVSLRAALQKYRDIAARGGWATSFTMKAAATPEQMARLRSRLAAEGDLAAPAGSAQVSASAAPDPALREAIKKFERRHGLQPDGRLDAEVVRELNVPVAARLRQLELNLERWRWLPESLGDKHILVNIPSFWLSGFEDGKTTISMRVVTGKVENPTPIFSDRMTHVVFSPYWNVPPTIAKEEIRPALMRDSGYLYKNNMEVVRGSKVVSPWSVDWDAGGFTVRQRPGGKNALGQVKFIFPNNFDVYLHDTPADALFSSNERTFSHGCVRVEKPFELAQWVLRGQQEWTPEKIRAAMGSGREQHVSLKQPVPVYLLYATAWVEPDGAVSFREDIYGHDKKHIDLLPASPVPVQVAQATPPKDAGARGN